jgi:hypothetical protein
MVVHHGFAIGDREGIVGPSFVFFRSIYLFADVIGSCGNRDFPFAWIRGCCFDGSLSVQLL